MEIAGEALIIIGIIFMCFGVIGIFRFKNFFAKILITAKIDTVGAVTLIAGIALKHGFSFFSLKLILIMILTLIINPLITHTIARSAFLSGYKVDFDQNESNEEGK